ncbi:MAG: bifunctional DNA-formamidopyrimidine glycosylase/DNA-(apurinic or apyrimidinic site) lyase [Lentisphaeria bacterium]|nr:bifunctional DNA-formamidopyrimidine glycosylase/DNA-(apurinic or apyrimidinic site) lyase [Lentisphaeria bacterium]
MPELPEVETVRRALARLLPGRTICGVEVFSPAMRNPLTPVAEARLEGCRIEAVRRRGRYLVIDLHDRRQLLAHLGMSGVIRVEPPTVPRRKHEHLFLHLSGDLVFRFECPRRFSMFKETRPAADTWPEELQSLGVEPFACEFSGDYLFRASRGRRTPVKTFLMDNAVVTGIGNIYAAETLFEAMIRPTRLAAGLTRRECQRLADAARSVLTRAIAAGGTTIHDYRQVDGSQGRFVQELQVYGRAGAVCRRCGGRIEQQRIAGRSTYFCPGCQKRSQI